MVLNYRIFIKKSKRTYFLNEFDIKRSFIFLAKLSLGYMNYPKVEEACLMQPYIKRVRTLN